MHWGRAKTILILAFLSLNVILGFQLWTNRTTDQYGQVIGLTGAVNELGRVLKSKNIRMAVEIPKETPKLKGFSVQIDEKFMKELSMKPTQSIKWSGVPSKSPNREQFLKQFVEKADAYLYDPATSSMHLERFTQMYEQYPMFDIRLEFIVRNDEVISYRQIYVEVLPLEQQEADEQKVIPAHSAIRSLAESYLPRGAVIVDVRLGYHGQLYNSQTQFMFPTWRIVTADGKIYYFNALNGAVEVPEN